MHYRAAPAGPVKAGTVAKTVARPQHAHSPQPPWQSRPPGGPVIQRVASESGPVGGATAAAPTYGLSPRPKTKAPQAIYVGGAADDWFTHIVEDYASGRGLFFSWSDVGDIALAIGKATEEGRPVGLVGHSLGGSAALKAASRGDSCVDLAVTIDPVGAVGSFKRSNIGVWVNVVAEPKELDSSDRVARFGGALLGGKPPSVASQADVSITSEKHHGQFVGMMAEAGAAGLIAGLGSASTSEGR
jgi:pimeloyl-ACP methyl ester carboxylesterase